MTRNKIVLALGLTSTIGLVGCSDSDGPSTGSSTGSSTPSTYTVKAIDGYLQNAKVWLDTNNNFQHDDNEPLATSGEGGIAKLDVTGISNPEQYPVVVQAIPGETIDEDKPDTPIETGFMMSAPAGETAITPLSTLVHVLLEESTDGITNPDELAEKKEEIVQQVAGELGLDEDEVLGDFNELDDEDKAEEIAFITRSIVESGVVLPETPQDLADAVEDVLSNVDDADFVKLAQVVNDEIKDAVEEILADSGKEFATEDAPISDPNLTDTDGDGVLDLFDAFPSDDSEYLDSDGDGVGNNADLNDDSVMGEEGYEDDAYPDIEDRFPTDPARAGDFDDDGIDIIDDIYPNDTDNDGYENSVDEFPTDPTEWIDEDEDGLGDSEDDAYPNDTDNDGYENSNDEFPTDPTEWIDEDEDGLGDNEDDMYPNDTDNDGYNNDVDFYPEDPDKWQDTSSEDSVKDFVSQEGTLYNFFSDDVYVDGEDVDVLYRETLTYSEDMLTLTAIEKYRSDAGTVAVEIDGDNDVQLSSEGWVLPSGYTIDFTSDSIIAYPEDYDALYYTVTPMLVDLEGDEIGDLDIEWDDFENGSVFPAGSTALKVSLVPGVDHYFLSDWNPWVVLNDAGYITDTDEVGSFDSFIVANSAGQSVATDLITAVHLYGDIGIEFVTGGIANYFEFDYENNQLATKIASSSYTIETMHGEELLMFTVPDAVNNSQYGWYDENPNMFLTIYDDLLNVGEVERAGDEDVDDPMYVLNYTAAQAITDNAILPSYLKQCNVGDTGDDGETDLTLSDFESAIEACGGRSNITREMVEGLNFHRVKSNGETRDTLFNADGTVNTLKSNGDDYTDNWTIEDGYIRATYMDDEVDYSAYWALLEADDNTWSIKYFESETIDGVTTHWIWADTIVEQPRGGFTFDPDNMTYQDGDGNLMFFHGDGSLTSVNFDEGDETYDNTYTWSGVLDEPNKVQIQSGGVDWETWTLTGLDSDEYSFSRYNYELDETYSETLFDVTYDLDATLCNTGDTPWDDEADEPESLGTAAEYTAAIEDCAGSADEFSASEFTGENADQNSRWQFLDIWEVNGTLALVVEEEVQFNSDGSGAFIDEEDGNFAFNWSIDNGQVELNVTAAEYNGSTETWTRMEQEGDLSFIKAFWSDVTWSEEIQATGDAEIYSAIVRFSEFN